MARKANSTRFSPERIEALQSILDLMRAQLPAGLDYGMVSITQTTHEYFRQKFGEDYRRSGVETPMWDWETSGYFRELNLTYRISGTSYTWVDITHSVEEAVRIKQALKGRAFWAAVEQTDLVHDHAQELTSEVGHVVELEAEVSRLRSLLHVAAQNTSEHAQKMNEAAQAARTPD